MATRTTSRAPKTVHGKGVLLTEKDRELLRFLCRYTCLTRSIVQRAMYGGRNRSGVYDRFNRLIRIGLIEDLRGPSNQGRFRDVHSLYVPTKEGYKVAATGLTPKTPARTTLLHTLAIADVGMMAEAVGYRVLTEREIASQVAVWRNRKDFKTRPLPADAPWIRTTSTDAGTRNKVPDLVVFDAYGGMHAVEIELTEKGDKELERVLWAYGSSDKFTSHMYYTDDPALKRRLEAIVKAMGDSAPRHFSVNDYVPFHSREW